MRGNDWEEVRLRYLVNINPSVPPEVRRSSEAEVSFLPMEAIGEDGSFDATKTRRVEDVLTGYSFFENGDIAYAKVTPCFENGKAAVLDGLIGGIGFGTTEVTVVRARDAVDTKFLFYVLIEDRFKQLGKAEMTGAGGLKRVPESFTRNFKVRLPRLDEQHAIASYLDRETTEIDNFIADQEELIALLNERRAATITRAVTKGLDLSAPMRDSGIEWLGDVPESWQITRIKHVARTYIGLTYAPEDIVDEDQGGTLVLRSGNVQAGEIDLSDCVYVSRAIPSSIRTRRGDILICARNGSRHLIGKNAVIGAESEGQTFGAFMSVLRSDLNPYLRWILNSTLFQAQMGLFVTATINQLTNSTLNNFEIPLPPESERKGIIDYLDRETVEIDAAIADAKEAIVLSKERRAALISAAVTGKIDVRYDITAELGAA